MATVACFCGCLYSFDGGGAACPKCGQHASATPTGPTPPAAPDPAQAFGLVAHALLEGWEDRLTVGQPVRVEECA